jgi:hypothetical protein
MQTLNTTPGSNYTLSFWLANSPFNIGGTVEVRWNGTTIYSQSAAQGFDYTQFTFSGLAATGSLTELELIFSENNEQSWFLDDVSVTPSGVGVPEPFSTLWLALPFVGMVAFRRFRSNGKSGSPA